MNRETETISKGAKRKNKGQRRKARRFAEAENGRIGRSIAATAMKKIAKMVEDAARARVSWKKTLRVFFYRA